MKLKYVTLAVLATLSISSCVEWQPTQDAVIVNKASGTEVLVQSALMYTAYKAIEKNPSLIEKFNAVNTTLGLSATDTVLSKEELVNLCTTASNGNKDVMLALNIIFNAYTQYTGNQVQINIDKYDSLIRATIDGITQAIDLYQYNQGK